MPYKHKNNTMKNNIFLLFITFFIFSCSKNEEAETDNLVKIESENTVILNAEQMKTAEIEVATLADQNIANKIRLNGIIDVPPQNMASVSAPSGGYVRTSKFMPGNHVQKGQTLVVLEDPTIVQLQQDYLLAKSNLNYAQNDYKRQKDLNQSKSSSEKTMQQAQTEATNQSIMVRGMAEKLRTFGIDPSKLTLNSIQRTVSVTSPISGYISSVNVNLGQYVNPSEVLIEIVNTDDVHLMLKVFERDLSKIKLNQTLEAFTNEEPQRKYKAKIILISKDFAPDRSVLIHCHFFEYEPKLIPGTFMNAEVETDSREAIIIPENGVITWEDKQYIFQEIKPQTFQMYPVKIGNSENGYTELVDFQSENATKRFVINGAYQLLMALKNVEE